MFITEILIAASDIKTLRKCDVERVVTWCDAAKRAALVDYIATERPDLAEEAENVLAEI